MNLVQAWEKALERTVVVRPRAKPLETFSATRLPYALLSASSVNPGDSVKRSGEVRLERPSLILPSALPQFRGFEFEKSGTDSDFLATFLLVRGVTLPSFTYDNRAASLEVLEGPSAKVRARLAAELERREDVETTLLEGPEDVWPFSLVFFVAALAVRSGEGDMRRILERYRSRRKWM
jgi:hypothetical protein